MRSRTAAILAAVAALGGSIPAFASPPGWAPAYGYRQHFHGRRFVLVAPAPVLAYRAAPVVVYDAPVYAYPAPVGYAPAYGVYPARGAGGAIAGAVAGALIGGTLASGPDRGAAIAVGSLLGAVIGHEVAAGY